MPPEVARPEGGMSVERLSDGAIEIIDDLHTERLDYTSEYLPLIDAANKLDAYEDTGLEPEEIEQLKGEVFGLKVDKQELEKYRAIGPIDRLRELVEADLADVAPVVHGRWESTGLISCKCSVCQHLELKGNEEYLYCPHCGEKMDKEDEDL